MPLRLVLEPDAIISLCPDQVLHRLDLIRRQEPLHHDVPAALLDVMPHLFLRHSDQRRELRRHLILFPLRHIAGIDKHPLHHQADRHLPPVAVKNRAARRLHDHFPAGLVPHLRRQFFPAHKLYPRIARNQHTKNHPYKQQRFTDIVRDAFLFAPPQRRPFL